MIKINYFILLSINLIILFYKFKLYKFQINANRSLYHVRKNVSIRQIRKKVR